MWRLSLEPGRRRVWRAKLRKGRGPGITLRRRRACCSRLAVHRICYKDVEPTTDTLDDGSVPTTDDGTTVLRPPRPDATVPTIDTPDTNVPTLGTLDHTVADGESTTGIYDHCFGIRSRRGLATGCMPPAFDNVPLGLLVLPSIPTARLRTRSDGVDGRNGAAEKGIVEGWGACVPPLGPTHDVGTASFCTWGFLMKMLLPDKTSLASRISTVLISRVYCRRFVC